MIPFSPPRIDQKIIDEVTDALRSGWITTGPKTKLFEKKITEYTGCKATLCTSSATAGLTMMLKWFDVGEGDEVILPAYTYCATANVIVHCGAKPVFVDVNRADFNISVESIKNALTSKTKVVIPVDLAGFPCDYNEINNLVRHKDIIKLFSPDNERQEKLGRVIVLSDGAHSIGAEYFGKKTGSLTDTSVFSFHAVKNLTTSEGGAIALNLPEPFNNSDIYKYLNIMSLHGQTKDAFTKTQSGKWKYDVIEAGFKANMTDIMAAMGLVELERYNEDMLARRKFIFDRYSEAFENMSWAELPLYESEQKVSSFHVYLLRIRDITEEQRDMIIERIFDKGVSVNVHYQPVPMLTFYSEKGYNAEDYPVAYDSYKREITLPVYYDLTDEQIDIVINSVKVSVKEVTGK